MKACIIIPSRIGSTRLPSKPLSIINGKSLITRVYEACSKQIVLKVFVATDSIEIKKMIEENGGNVILTKSSLTSGTDRVHAALSAIDPDKNIYSHIINVQGDIPNIDPYLITELYEILQEADADIVTPAVLIKNKEHIQNPSIVKAVISFKNKTHGRALYFTRSAAPYGEGELYEHIGIYAYKREALEKFVSLPPSPLEIRESLEQLRALEAGMKIDIRITSERFMSVDTYSDLENARKLIK